MVAPNVLVKLPWKKIVQELGKLAPIIYNKVKEVLDERKKAKERVNKENILTIEGKLNVIEDDLKSVGNNISTHAEVIQKTQDQIGLIMSGLNKFRTRQNILIGLTCSALIISILSIVSVILR